jgi:hypothetical protein
MDQCLELADRLRCDARIERIEGREVEMEFAEKNGIPCVSEHNSLLEWRKEKELEAGE